MRIRWVRKKEVWRPTAAGYVLALLITLFLLRVGAPQVFRFLAGGRPLSEADVVVVEGWLSDEDLEAALGSPALAGATPIVTTGGPIESGRMLTPYEDYANFTRDRLMAMGIAGDRVTSVPAARTRRDRTYASARALRQYLEQKGIATGRLNLVTRGVHARRSALLYREALGPSFQLGVWVLPDEFDAGDWWHSSQGFRAVMYEMFAWCYARIFLIFRSGGEP